MHAVYLTLGVFLSVFLLTNTGLSYLTSDAFGGIILMCFFCDKQAECVQSVKCLQVVDIETIATAETSCQVSSRETVRSRMAASMKWEGLVFCFIFSLYLKVFTIQTPNKHVETIFVSISTL